MAKENKETVKREMKKDSSRETVKEETKKNLFKHHKKADCGGFYFLGVIGAAIYFIGQATTFWIGVLGLLKAFVRPVFLVHGLLKFLGL